MKLSLILALSLLRILVGAPQKGGSSPIPDEVPPPSFAELQRIVNVRYHEQAIRVAAKEQYFVTSFNGLAAALDDFSKSYKATHTIDPKQVKRIRDAYRKLEQADKWFRAE